MRAHPAFLLQTLTRSALAATCGIQTPYNQPWLTDNICNPVPSQFLSDPPEGITEHSTDFTAAAVQLRSLTLSLWVLARAEIVLDLGFMKSAACVLEAAKMEVEEAPELWSSLHLYALGQCAQQLWGWGSSLCQPYAAAEDASSCIVSTCEKVDDLVDNELLARREQDEVEE